MPNEEEEYLAKQKAGKDVFESQKYLARKFYDYATDKETYNFTKEVFHENVEQDIKIFISFVINQTIDFNYDGEIKGWEYSWTFPKALLFTITIMTTIGKQFIFFNEMGVCSLFDGFQSLGYTLKRAPKVVLKALRAMTARI